MSLDDVLGQLRDGLQQWETGAAALEGAVAKAEQLSQQFGTLGADGQAARLAEVRQLLESARAQLNLQTPREAEHLIWQATGQQGQATVGDPVSEPRGESAPGSFRQELNSTDDGDSGLSKARRFGRAFARNTSGVRDASKDATTSASFAIDDYDPDVYGNTHATVGVPTQSPVISSNMADVKASDVVGSTVVVAVIAVEGISRLVRKRHGR